MRINNNVSALNAWRNLTATDGFMNKSLERLSSGYRINRAADDAAGLAMSEKMRSQIKGMNQAIRNAQDGISLVQTAEGALTEVHTILQRMNELAVQAANGTNTGADRNKIQQEMDELASETTRITNTTAFNSKELLNGSMKQSGTGQATFQIGPNANQTLDIEIAAMDAKTLGVARDVREVVDNNDIINTMSVAPGCDSVGGPAALGLNDGNYVVEVQWDATASQYVAALYDKQDFSTNGGSATGGTATVLASKNPVSGQLVSFHASGIQNGTIDITFDNNLQQPAAGGVWTAEIELQRAQSSKFVPSSGGSDGYKLTDAVTIGGLDVTTSSTASKAITAINTAINTVSAQRAQLGAIQNRLEHTINNLSVVSENLTASESRIRDVDMAQEMTQFTKQQILMQAGTAMLAQANAKNQNVLTLLRG